MALALSHAQESEYFQNEAHSLEKPISITAYGDYSFSPEHFSRTNLTLNSILNGLISNKTAGFDEAVESVCVRRFYDFHQVSPVPSVAEQTPARNLCTQTDKCSNLSFQWYLTRNETTDCVSRTKDQSLLP